MEVKDLERSELFELVDVLSARLGRSIKEECILTLRVKGLERALEAATKDARCKDDGQNEYVVKLLRAEKRIKELEEANNSLAETGKRHLAESQIYQNEAKGLERELKNCRATVMNEVSAMIPKAVEAERAACADIARAEALRCAMPENTSRLMAVVNMIKARGGK